MTMRKTAFIVTFMCLAATALLALGERGSPVTEAMIYISPDASSSHLARAARGRELVILDATEKWLHVEALLSDPQPDIEYAVNEDEDEGKTVTGWIMRRDVILTSTPDGDKILFGEAVDSEDQASQAHGRPGAAQDAQRLYYRVADLFPILLWPPRPCTVPPTSDGKLTKPISCRSPRPESRTPICAARLMSTG